MDNGKICCFTGHRTIAERDVARLPALLTQTLETLYEQGVRTFRTGGALGFDTFAAQAVLSLRKLHSDIHLSLYLPCREQCNKWRPADIKIYKDILAAADEYTFITTFYHPLCMQTRNLKLIEDADYCVCYKHAGAGGGTAYTVKHAKENEVEIINLADQLDV